MNTADADDEFDLFIVIVVLGCWPLLTEFSRFDWILHLDFAGNRLGLSPTRSIVRIMIFEGVGLFLWLAISRSLSSLSDSDCYSSDDIYSSGGSFGVQMILFHSSNRMWRASLIHSPHCGEDRQIAEKSLFECVVSTSELWMGVFGIRWSKALAPPVWRLQNWWQMENWYSIELKCDCNISNRLTSRDRSNPYQRVVLLQVMHHRCFVAFFYLLRLSLGQPSCGLASSPKLPPIPLLPEYHSAPRWYSKKSISCGPQILHSRHGK